MLWSNKFLRTIGFRFLKWGIVIIDVLFLFFSIGWLINRIPNWPLYFYQKGYYLVGGLENEFDFSIYWE